MSEYLRPSVSNGHPMEQAMIRKWWNEVHGARGRIVWEYHLGGCYADAMWFPDAEENGAEYPGTMTGARFPISGARVIVCEAKTRLTHGLIGQAVTYQYLARKAGAQVHSVVVFAQTATASFLAVAEDAGFQVVIGAAPK